MDFGQAVSGHLEKGEFARRAEAILDRAEHAESAGILLEGQDGVHHMFKHTRTGDRSVFGDVTDKDDRNLQTLGEAQKSGRYLADLTYASWCGCDLFGVHRLDGVDDTEGSGLSRGKDQSGNFQRRSASKA